MEGFWDFLVLLQSIAIILVIGAVVAWFFYYWKMRDLFGGYIGGFVVGVIIAVFIMNRLNHNKERKKY